MVPVSVFKELLWLLEITTMKEDLSKSFPANTSSARQQQEGVFSMTSCQRFSVHQTPGKVHRPTETDECRLAWSNGSNRAFGILLRQVFAYQPFHAIHCSAWGMVPKLLKHEPSCKFFSYTHSPVSLLKKYHYMEPEFKTEAKHNSEAPMHFLEKLVYMFCGSVLDGVRNKVGFMKVQVCLTIDFHMKMNCLLLTVFSYFHNQVGSKGFNCCVNNIRYDF